MQLNAAALTSLDVCNERTGMHSKCLRNPNWEIMPYAVFILPWVLILRIDGETCGFSLMITILLGMKNFKEEGEIYWQSSLSLWSHSNFCIREQSYLTM